jgi:hypothetical protein
MGRPPLAFEPNVGQTDARVKFLSRGPGYTLFLTPHEAVLALADTQTLKQADVSLGQQRPQPPQVPAGTQVVRMQLLGIRRQVSVSGLEVLPGKTNYFRGDDPRNWRQGIANYAKVRYAGVYPGVDLVYYGTQGQLEYDFVVAPGASVHDISLGFSGASSADIDHDSGDLVLHAGNELIRFHRPVAYQLDTSGLQRGKTNVSASYVLEAGNRVHFRVGPYDKSKALVIDPTLGYGTYLGGSGNDYGNAIAVDSAGSAYVTGYTGSTNFPVVGGVQTKCGGNCAGGTSDAFISKFSATGSVLVYSTYLGGSQNDYGNGIVVDSAGNAYVIGQTYSSDFPTTTGSYMSSCGTNCSSGFAFIAKLNPTGAALSYSTYLGGSAITQGNAIAIDTSGNAYVTGYTKAKDFPITTGVFQPTCSSCTSGFVDSFITKLNSTGSGLVYSSYLGGNNADVGYAIVIDASDNAYITGYTYSTNFPTTVGAYQTKLNATTAGFVTKINGTATGQVYSTYLGGSATGSSACPACATGIAVDSSGNTYIVGLTWETNFPTTTGAYQTTYAGGFHDAFVTELNTGGNALVYSTYLGGKGDDGAASVAIDSSGNVYVRGNTYSSNFPTTPGAYQTKLSGTGSTSDAFLAIVNSGGSTLGYSTYLGGTGTEYAGAMASIALSSANPPSVYLTGYTNSTNFPATKGAYQTKNNGLNDGFVAKFSPSPNVGTSGSLNFGNQDLGTTSSPLTITVTNTGNQNLNVTAISITGADPADFAQTNDCRGGIAAGGNCTINVTFSPQTTGTRNANVSITDNAPNSPQAVALTGVGVGTGPAVTLSPTSLTFPTTLVGTNSSPQSVTLTNTGSSTLNLKGIQISGDYTYTTTCGATVNAGANCTLTVTFTPQRSGTRTGTVTITDDAPDSPQSIPLTGTGTYIEVVPTSLTFADQKVGTTSSPMTVTLTNTATSVLSIKTVSITGTNNSDFAQTNTCGASVAAGASCTFSVTFTPSATGSRSADLTITDYQGGTATQTVPLSGTGT